MRVLFVAPVSPHPARTGTSVIALNQIRGLAKRHQVELVALTSPDARSDDVGPLADLCRSVTLAPRPSKLRGMVNRGVGLTWGRPWEVSRFASLAMRRAVAAALASGPDIVLFQLTETVQFRPRGDTTASVWSMEDPAVLKAERMLPWAPASRQPFLRLRLALLRRYEERRIGGFARVLLINRGDLADYRAVHPDARFAWVPYGVVVEPGEPPPRAARRPGRIVISGNMFHPPNARAVAFFCRDVLPLILAAIPEASLSLVGAHPPPSVLALARDARVTVTGFVPDLRPQLREAMVSVCAVDLKVGTQTKVLEALAEGTPVVTTSAGNHGIGGEDGRQLHVADDAETMAARVISLLHGERWDELAREGRLHATGFSWESAVSRLDDVLGEVVSERRGGREKERRAFSVR